MKKAIQLSEVINNLGNALTAANWPVNTRNVPAADAKTYDTKEIYKELVCLGFDMKGIETDLRDCVNELCYRCGDYKEEHLGACEGCRWKAVRHSDN